MFLLPLTRYFVSTSPAGGEVLNSVFNATTFNVILRRERSELSGESRNITSIFLNRMYRPGYSANELSLKAKDDESGCLLRDTKALSLVASWHIMLGVPPKNDNKKRGEVIGLLRVIILKTNW